ncbi:MAG: hypothetical protein WDN24_08505 [Sphingomonas sp.]
MSQELLETTRSASSGRLIAYEKAEVVSDPGTGSYYLWVSGKAPCLNMSVSLEPRIYIDCPEYWGIEVVGDAAQRRLPAGAASFNEVLFLYGVIGHKGIEVIGSTRSRNSTFPEAAARRAAPPA